MAKADDDTADILTRIGETFSGVKFGRGVVAKTGHAMIGLLIVWCVVAWRWTDNLAADGGLLLVGTIASCVFLRWMSSTQAFAERNPAQAMLDGAEFLEYRKFEEQAKGQGAVAVTALTSDPQQPLVKLLPSGAVGGPDRAQ
jgi:hypothetical protein